MIAMQKASTEARLASESKTSIKDPLMPVLLTPRWKNKVSEDLAFLPTDMPERVQVITSPTRSKISRKR